MIANTASTSHLLMNEFDSSDEEVVEEPAQPLRIDWWEAVKALQRQRPSVSDPMARFSAFAFPLSTSGSRG